MALGIFTPPLCGSVFSHYSPRFQRIIIKYPRFAFIFVSRPITSIETRNVRFFKFVFSVKGMISVILILVVAVYQQILSRTEQGFIGLLTGNQPCFWGGSVILYGRKGVGHVSFINHISKCSSILFDQSLIFPLIPQPQFSWI